MTSETETGGDSNKTEFKKEEYKGIVDYNKEGKKWGFDLYPERRGDTYKPGLAKAVFGFEGTENTDRYKCERRIWEEIHKSKMIKLLFGALNSAGCPVDIRRHMCCEVCDGNVTGGYDQQLNQIVVCQNTVKNNRYTRGVIIHELIHMFDYCVNKMDFKSVEHLACTEIRAAVFSHCSFLSSMTHGTSSFFNIAATHQDCVKYKAVWSVMAVHRITQDEATAVVNKVFDKCYKDLEPIGRIPRSRSNDDEKAFVDGEYFGYLKGDI